MENKRESKTSHCRNGYIQDANSPYAFQLNVNQ